MSRVNSLLLFYIIEEEGNPLIKSPICSYDGISCEDFGLILVQVGSSVTTSSRFGLNRTIQEESVRGRKTPYFYGYDESPHDFPVTFAKYGEWTDAQKTEVVKWLYKKDYKSFVSNDNIDITYYCMPVGEATFNDTGYGEGYVTLNMRCNSSYGYLPKQELDFTIGTSPTTITIVNGSGVNENYYPYLEVTVNSGTSFSLDNLQDSRSAFAFTGLNQGEKLYIDNERKIIETDAAGVYRMNDFNKKWLRLLPGTNQIEVTGLVTLHFELRFPVAIGW